MKNFNQMPRHTVFYKFIAVNIAVMAVFYGITLYINSHIARSQENDIYQSSANKLELFLSNLETDIERQQQIQSQFIDRYDLQKLSVAGSRLSEYDKVSIIQRIQADVVVYRIMCEYCDNITVSIPSVERVISVRPILDYFESEQGVISVSNTTSEPFTFEDKPQGSDALFSVMNTPRTPIENRPPLYSVRIDIATGTIIRHEDLFP
jgi:hypothetical protein